MGIEPTALSLGSCSFPRSGSLGTFWAHAHLCPFVSAWVSAGYSGGQNRGRFGGKPGLLAANPLILNGASGRI
jgi:hypothetical protein